MRFYPNSNSKFMAQYQVTLLMGRRTQTSIPDCILIVTDFRLNGNFENVHECLASTTALWEFFLCFLAPHSSPVCGLFVVNHEHKFIREIRAPPMFIKLKTETRTSVSFNEFFTC
ncbi:hypothetical protein CDAR_464711 [Caerostris darwini]|uniref:Uncharacterized protein n=1 Tax=Caerostris darwini TaxID=1538125 RepID=A0AAV4Q6E7_9ARAC|nr:hypothetical protein CDAR_464711 [Caerostris darwini]